MWKPFQGRWCLKERAHKLPVCVSQEPCEVPGRMAPNPLHCRSPLTAGENPPEAGRTPLSTSSLDYLLSRMFKILPDGKGEISSLTNRTMKMDLGWGNRWGFPGGASGKEPACQCRSCKRHWFSPRLGRAPGEERANPLQDSWLENRTNRGSWRPPVHGLAKSRTWLEWLST